jgi:uncharacterized membrane protein (DUF373 family)
MSSGGRPSQFGPVDVDSALGYSERLIHLVEVVAAFVLVVLFAVGVADLSLQIVQSALSGRIVDPLVVVGFIDTALLLFIIVEIYQTVVAYTRESERREIVRLVLYTGVIALVRKAIIFRTEVYDSSSEAILAASSYALLLVGVGIVLYVERRTAAA